MIDPAPLWDFNDPAASSRLFRELAAAASPEGVAILRTQVARALGLQGRYADGHADLDDVESASSGSSVVSVRVALERGRLLRSSGSPEAARVQFEQAASLAGGSGHEALEIDALHMVALVAPADEQLVLNQRALALARQRIGDDARTRVAWATPRLEPVDILSLPDSRQAQLWLGGADDGPVVLFFHGCPDTRWAARFADDAARDGGGRLLCGRPRPARDRRRGRAGHVGGWCVRRSIRRTTCLTNPGARDRGAEQDAAIIRRLPVAAVAASAREALADHHGLLRDAALLHQPWEIDLASVACPTHLWYGEADQRAMPGARWFADRIPHASLVVRPHSTHLATLADHWPDILANLTDRPFPC